MRRLMAMAAALVLAACGQGPSSASAAGAPPTAKPVTIKAGDGVTVYGRYYPAPNPKALILLFHQAGSSKDEYATIAPRLVKDGYAALAIDQRSGGTLYGPNQTAAALGRSADYLEAKRDLQAALDWAKARGNRPILWGSSYSSALVFLVAADNPGAVKAVLSFSPGEYLGRPDLVKDAAARVQVPVFVTSAKDSGEIAAAKAIFDKVPTRAKVRFVPQTAGIHGSSTLIDRRNPAGAGENWRAVEAFLRSVAP